jgi:hypothetical protein
LRKERRRKMKGLDDYDIDPLSTEDKIILAHERPFELEPWEITEVVQRAMRPLSQDLDVEDADVLFDVIYDAVSEALERARMRF